LEEAMTDYQRLAELLLQRAENLSARADQMEGRADELRSAAELVAAHDELIEILADCAGALEEVTAPDHPYRKIVQQARKLIGATGQEDTL
jgi:hypothetical protein